MRMKSVSAIGHVFTLQHKNMVSYYAYYFITRVKSIYLKVFYWGFIYIYGS